jgi:F-type H+-transporting ATPase subunit delta
MAASTLLPEIAAQFAVLKNAQAGAADATVQRVRAVADQVNTLVATLEKKFGRKLNPTVDSGPVADRWCARGRR